MSLAFPGLSSTELVRFVAGYAEVDDTTLARQFRAWVREQLVEPAGGGGC